MLKILRVNRLLFAPFLVMLLLLGCNTSQPEDATEVSPNTTSTERSQQPETSETPTGPGDSYPGPSVNSAYPDGENGNRPTRLPAEIVAVPEPSSSDVGVVTGVLTVEQDGASKPVPEAILYLGRVIKLDDGRPAMSALNKQVAPSTQSNGAGQFIFTDIEPGLYALVLDRVTDSFVLNSPETGDDLLIEVEGGEIFDLGELRYSNLPLELE